MERDIAECAFCGQTKFADSLNTVTQDGKERLCCSECRGLVREDSESTPNASTEQPAQE